MALIDTDMTQVQSGGDAHAPGAGADADARTRGATIDALIVDAAQRQALVAVRELGKAGLAVGALDSDPHAPGLASKWSTTRVVVPDFVQDQHAYVDAVLRACAEHRPQSLILGHDGSIEALRRRRSEVERVVGLALAPEAALEVAIDKTKTLAFAETIGLRAPRGAFVTAPGEAAAAVDDVGLPAVVKPTRSWAQQAGIGQRLVAVVVRTRAEALAAIEEVLKEGIEVVLQEWLPGDREALSFFHARGRTWARFAQRADRTFPPLGGNSVLRESIPLPEDVAPAAERLVAELGLDGYSEVEFRRDAQGRPALMEINPRLSASVEIAVRAGVPFPRLLHDWASGRPLQEVSGYRSGLRMRWLGGDLSWLKSVLAQSSGPDVPSRARSLASFAADFARPMSYDYLDRSDPRPALAAAGGVARRVRRNRSAGGSSRAGTAGLDTEAVVIGAGPYGLSVSAHLTGRGVRHETFGETMELWSRHMPAGMYLKSEGFASNMGHPAGEFTLEQFCAENENAYDYRHVASPIPLDTFERYGRWFQRHAVPDLRESRVERVRKVPSGFEVQISTGETLRAKSVVVATGMTSYAHLPAALQGLSDRALVHTYEHRDPAESRGLEVAVVGAGQSALESAALLREQGATVHVIARTNELAWNSKPGGSARPLRDRWKYPESGLGEGRSQWVYANYPLAFHLAPESQRMKRAYTALGPAGAWWLRQRIIGHMELALGRSVVAAHEQDGRVRLELESAAGPEELLVAQVIAGTGYRPDVNRLPFLDPALSADIESVIGTPLLDSSFQSTAPGLHFVGYPAGLSFGPVMRFVYGADFAARTVARRIAGIGAQMIRTYTQLGPLAAEWDELARDAGSPFMTHAWLSSWWSGFGHDDPIWIVLQDADGSLRAGAFLHRSGGKLAAAANVHSADWNGLARDEPARAELWGAIAELGANRIQLRALPEHGEGTRCCATRWPAPATASCACRGRSAPGWSFPQLGRVDGRCQRQLALAGSEAAQRTREGGIAGVPDGHRRRALRRRSRDLPGARGIRVEGGVGDGDPQRPLDRAPVPWLRPGGSREGLDAPVLPRAQRTGDRGRLRLRVRRSRSVHQDRLQRSAQAPLAGARAARRGPAVLDRGGPEALRLPGRSRRLQDSLDPRGPPAHADLRLPGARAPGQRLSQEAAPALEVRLRACQGALRRQARLRGLGPPALVPVCFYDHSSMQRASSMQRRAERVRVVTLVDLLSSQGGAEHFALVIATRLDPERFESTLCISRYPPPAGFKADSSGREALERLEQAGVRFLPLARRRKVGLAPWVRLERFLRRERVDVLHSHKFGSNVAGSFAARLAGVPVVLAHEHTWSYEGQPWRRFLDRELVSRAADRFIAVSREDQRRMIEVEHIKPDRTMFIPIGILPSPPPDGRDMRAELDIPSDAPVIGVVGVMRPQKAHHVLLHAAALLKPEWPGIQVLLVGDGQERAALEQMTEELGLEPNVRFLGLRGDVPELLRALDIAVCCSDFEGSPAAILEYMDAALPVVATSVGGIPDLIESDVHGLLVPPGDPAALGEALAELLRDPERAREMGRRGQERRRSEFDLDVMIRRLEGLYLELLDKRGRRRPGA